MNNNAWKVLAIVFIVLFVLETLFLVWVYQSGERLIQLETECAYVVCEDYEAYLFDEDTEMCYCYYSTTVPLTEKESNIALTKYIGG